MGSNRYGQLGDGDSNTLVKYSPILIESLMDQDASEVQCGNYHTLLQTRYGKVFAWGNNDYGQCGAGDRNLKYMSDSKLNLP